MVPTCGTYVWYLRVVLACGTYEVLTRYLRSTYEVLTRYLYTYSVYLVRVRVHSVLAVIDEIVI